MGVLFTELGFLPRNALSKIDSYFLPLFSILMTIFSFTVLCYIWNKDNDWERPQYEGRRIC